MIGARVALACELAAQCTVSFRKHPANSHVINCAVLLTFHGEMTGVGPHWRDTFDVMKYFVQVQRRG
jgi:hypothetical protein